MRNPRYLNQESAMLPRLPAKLSYYEDLPMATRLNWIQRALRKAAKAMRKTK